MKGTRQVTLFDVFIRPLASQGRRLGEVALALAVLSAGQGLVIVLVGPLLMAMFSLDPSAQVVRLAPFVPPPVLRFLPEVGAIQWPAATLALAIPLGLFLAGLAHAAGTYLYHVNQEALALYVAKSYRDRLFASVVALPYVEIRTRPAGGWMSLIMNDVWLLQNRYSDIMTSFVRDGVLMVTAFATLAVLHWPSAVALALLAPVGTFALGRAAKRIAFFAEWFQKELSRLASAVLDLRSRFDFVRAQQGEETERLRFEALNERYYGVIRRSILIRSAFAPMLEFCGFLVTAAFIWAMARGLLPGLSPEQMGPLLTTLGVMFRPMRNLGEQLTRFEETRGSLKQSLETFEKLGERGERGHPPHPSESGTGTPSSRRGLEDEVPVPDSEGCGGCPLSPLSPEEISIDRVAVGFGEEIRFEGTGLHLKRGKAYAIIGPSGAGKSTFVKSLAGLIVPRVFESRLGWAATAELSSMVSQDPFLFEGSVRENLVYGLPKARQPGDEDVWRVLREVNVAEEVRAIPGGLDGRVRAIGSNFSGGQIQRLVIARALLHGPPLWLLDEATSAVDPRTEGDVTRRLIDACHRDQRSCLVMVTHRLRFLSLFDEVWFVEAGRVAAAGRHADLLRHERYRAFFEASEADRG